ncbi:MAG: hypothetical protein FWH07_03480 [Oscillospiraceae bacterium]|nr:hypothetical protein [Oscillospiraceae bacterium]
MVYRIGFTRKGGQGIKDGWQAVNISPGIPPEIIGRYTALQNSNTPPGPVFEPEDSEEKTVTELQSDNHNVYFSRIKYGLADSQGRPSMFADSFVCDLKQFAENPSKLLLIKSGNFHFEVNEDESAQPESAPELLPAPELKLSLNPEQYAVLIKCVYSVMTARNKETLYIICGGSYSDETVAETMLCIYSALFLPFRKVLTFATYETHGNVPKSVIFKRRQSGGESKYFNLETGETNIKRFDNYGFIDEIAENPKQANLNYFKSFESDLREYGCSETTSLALYKIVWETGHIDSILADNDCILTKKLNELLSVAVPKRTLLDEQILLFLTKIFERNINLNDILAQKLAGLPPMSANEALSSICTVYIYQKLKSLIPNEDLLPDFADGSSEMVFEITEEAFDEIAESPIEVPDDFFEIEEGELHYDEYENRRGHEDEHEYKEEAPENPIKKFIKIFSKK